MRRRATGLCVFLAGLCLSGPGALPADTSWSRLQSAAEALDAQMKFKEAINDYEQALKLVPPQNQDARIVMLAELAADYIRLDLPEKAKPHADQAVSLVLALRAQHKEPDPECLMALGSTVGEAKSHPYPKAIQKLEICVHIAENVMPDRPDLKTIENEYAEYLAVEKLYSRAIDELRHINKTLVKTEAEKKANEQLIAAVEEREGHPESMRKFIEETSKKHNRQYALQAAANCELWAKKAVLLYFRLRPIEKMDEGHFFDKVPMKKFAEGMNRIVPYSSVRKGAYVAAKVVIMAPSFINIGAYVDEGAMVDSLVLVGSCARIGTNVHLGAGTIIGGVLEPPNSAPVIIEDGAFIGGGCGIYEGCLVEANAVIAAGTNITASTPIIDAQTGEEFLGRVPENAVVIPGGRPKKIGGHDYIVQTPLIIKRRDPSVSAKLALEDSLRQF